MGRASSIVKLSKLFASNAGKGSSYAAKVLRATSKAAVKSTAVTTKAVKGASAAVAKTAASSSSKAGTVSKSFINISYTGGSGGGIVKTLSNISTKGKSLFASLGLGTAAAWIMTYLPNWIGGGGSGGGGDDGEGGGGGGTSLFDGATGFISDIISSVFGIQESISNILSVFVLIALVGFGIWLLKRYIDNRFPRRKRRVPSHLFGIHCYRGCSYRCQRSRCL